VQRTTSAALTAIAVCGLVFSAVVFAVARDATWQVVPNAWLASVVCASMVRSRGKSDHRPWATAVLAVCAVALLGAVALVVFVLLAIGRNGLPA
jgi:hypothetical protein